jgi:hypothetical protein
VEYFRPSLVEIRAADVCSKKINDLFCVDKVDISCAEREKKNRKRTDSRTTAHTHTPLSVFVATQQWRAEDGKQGKQRMENKAGLSLRV